MILIYRLSSDNPRLTRQENSYIGRLGAHGRPPEQVISFVPRCPTIVATNSSTWVRSIRYRHGAITVNFFDRVFTYLCAPLYTIMNLALLPVRL